MFVYTISDVISLGVSAIVILGAIIAVVFAFAYDFFKKLFCKHPWGFTEVAGHKYCKKCGKVGG
jgi:uncharacterized membrane protein